MFHLFSMILKKQMKPAIFYFILKIVGSDLVSIKIGRHLELIRIPSDPSIKCNEIVVSSE